MKYSKYKKHINTINLGPTHPATHGVFQNILKVDGEKIISSIPSIGYIHRAFEKIAEKRPYYQITPLTDRLNYCSAPINNLGWYMTLEKVLDIKIPKRVDYMRVLIMELARIADHLICNGILGVDSGSYSGFLYLFQEREKIYDIFEEICGARLTTNIGRIGGFERNFSDIALSKIKSFIQDFPFIMENFEKLFVRNRIFMDRCIGVSSVTPEMAINYSWSGPLIRATGIDYDIRVIEPYSSYEDFEFNIPVGTNGDVYDRFIVRNNEIWESLNIIKQAMEKINKLNPNEYHANVPHVYLPDKNEVYNNMEALIYHFKIIMGEINMKNSEIYHSVEGANGELGFYLITDGGRTPYRLHFRRPSFVHYQSYPEIIIGSLLSDAILTMSSMNIIAGELDA
ncbi:MAG: NADH-quinone oxidoreductase subunit D [Bacteroides sp.]|nr:MAG: NADH-quinone oxidoreductase subunit D [Bacteroides sp.]